MRPLPGDDAFLGRQRPADTDATLFHSSSANAAPQMTYFLADQESVDASVQQANAAFLRQQRDRDRERKNAATQSISCASPDAQPSASGETSMSSSISIDPNETEASRPSSSLPMTPVLGVSDHGSALSSSSSRRNSLSGSFLEEHQSHGISAAQEEEKEAESVMMDSGCAPQLVMPSIKMPSRRPFTEVGKSMGRLKVLVAGDSGIGKTSLIKAIVQTCEHIVHVDPITPSTFSSRATTSKARGNGTKRSKTDSSTRRLTEIYASTKPYPPWWSDVDDVSTLRRRRKSLGDNVLERNLCFIDTPGYGSASSAVDVMMPVVEYVEAQLRRLSTQSLTDSELLSLVGGDGGCQVDVVFYVINDLIKPADVEYLRLLYPLTNIIPILSKADRISPSELEVSKAQIASQIRQAAIRPFMFGEPDQKSNVDPSAMLYAVSSATGSDYDTMDASLLMSPGYVQPLFPTDLTKLVENVFSVDGTAWLRHTAARKYLSWKSEHNVPQLHGIPKALPAPNFDLPQLAVATPGSPPTSYPLARLADHRQREERMAQVRLANWAAELQRTLANERARYEMLAKNERAVWLTERLSECVQDGTLVPRMSSVRASKSPKTKNGQRRRPSRVASHQDPLGLLEVVVKLKRRGRMVLELLGSLGIIGGLAFWASRNYWHVSAYEWVMEEWFIFWGIEK